MVAIGLEPGEVGLGAPRDLDVERALYRLRPVSGDFR